MYPAHVHKFSVSLPGGKVSHLVMVLTQDHRAMVIERWGKAGTWGHGWLVTIAADATRGMDYYNDRRDALKVERGSAVTIPDAVKIAGDKNDLKVALGTYGHKITPAERAWLFDGGPNPNLGSASAARAPRSTVIPPISVGVDRGVDHGPTAEEIAAAGVKSNSAWGSF